MVVVVVVVQNTVSFEALACKLTKQKNNKMFAI